MEVYVSAVESPSRFWVQLLGPGTIALDKLVIDMTLYYNEEGNREIHELKNVNIYSNILTRSYMKQGKLKF